MSEIGRLDVTRDHRPRGFTLLEMLVVLAISGLVSTIVFPSIEHGIATLELRNAVVNIETALREGRNRAIREDQTIQFKVAPDRQHFVLSGTRSEGLPNDIRVEATPTAIGFFDDGTSTGGQVTVTSAKYKSVLVISAVTGRVTHQ